MGRRRTWTEQADAILVDGLDRDLSYAEIAAAIRAACLVPVSEGAVASRADRLELTHARLGDHVADCRGEGGHDALLDRLHRLHKRPPADVVERVTERQRLDWRALVPGFGSAGSPAAACMDA